VINQKMIFNNYFGAILTSFLCHNDFLICLSSAMILLMTGANCVNNVNIMHLD